MENRTIFLAYLVVWCPYVLAVHFWAHRKRLNLGGVIVSHALPSVVAIVMTYIFLIAGGATVAQFVAGSETGKNLWYLWGFLWPILLFGSATSAFISLVWTIVSCITQSHRKWVFINIAAVMMSVFAFFTVAANFPDA
ncbi:hypothetical protein STSP2_00983 [Anaerohalosphaera lusitana]|uniref:Uncharacterized protein n=1 Tax=Anaerohalosphaera lusitana TaxID=1936003 RepID=A0A1U9NIS1_9BACT|nr:hypothetical protein [Anaerohalosphaera lusitana]AQT67832.1 hypothetical protein STSP2_00983 [Anaerohalosphaera lusitana]